MNLTKRRIIENAIIFVMGAVGYYMLEVLWRGYSHWTMAFTGGICFTILYFIANSERLKNVSLLLKCALGSLSITVIEFVVGLIVNKWLMWHVWDYSDMYFNLMGQICLLFSLIWFFLCFPAMYLCKACKRTFFSERAEDAKGVKVEEKHS